MFGPGFRSILAFAYAEPLAAVPAPARERSLRVPRAGVSLLGGRPGRLRRPPPLAGPGLEGGRHGPQGVSPPGPPAPRMAPDERRGSPQAQTRQGTRTMRRKNTSWFSRLAPCLLALGLILSPGRPGPGSRGRRRRRREGPSARRLPRHPVSVRARPLRRRQDRPAVIVRRRRRARRGNLLARSGVRGGVMEYDWDGLRATEFPVTRRWAYLDHAAVAPLPRRSGDALRAWAEEQENNGVVHWPAWEREARGDPRPGRAADRRRARRDRLRQQHDPGHRPDRRRLPLARRRQRRDGRPRSIPRTSIPG